jgi:hypothetical protein
MKDHKIIYSTKNTLSSPSRDDSSSSSSFSVSPSSFSLSFPGLKDSCEDPPLSSQHVTTFPTSSSHERSYLHSHTREKSLEFAVNSSRDLEPGQQAPGSNSSSSRYRDQRIITKKEYFLFCFGFSVSVAPVIGVFTFAPVIFGRGGGVGNGIFCIGYTLSSLFYTRNIITSYGSKSAILWGHFGSGIYVAYYLLCTTVAFRYSNIIYPMGAFIGGISQSIMSVPTPFPRSQLSSM